MGRFLILLSIVLMIGSIGYFIWVLQGPSNEQVGSFLSGIVCEENEKLTQQTGAYVGEYGSSTGLTVNGRETAFYCVGLEGERRSVTGETTLIIGGGFAVPLVLSIILMIVGIARAASSATRSIYSSFGGVTPLGTPGVSVYSMSSNTPYSRDTVPPEVLSQVNSALDHAGLSQISGGGSFSERLRQLEDARKQGLISQSEYNNLRQSILDSMDE